MGKSNIQIMIDEVDEDLKKLDEEKAVLLQTRKRLEDNEKKRQECSKQKAAEKAEKKSEAA